MIKKVIYENSLGKMIFDGRKMYCQSIDCNGNSVSSTTEQLFNSHGQRTISRYFNAKTIPCSFLLADLDDNHALRQRIVEILNPIITGTLTVQTEHGTYSIDCYPSESSSFKRSEVNYCYLWNVDFVADFPFWRKGVQNAVQLAINSGTTTIQAFTVPDTPLILEFDASGGARVFNVNGKSISLRSYSTKIIVDTYTYRIKDANGNDCGNILDVTQTIDDILFKPGSNTAYYAASSSGASGNVTIKWYDLVTGVF